MTREEAIQILSTRDAHGVLCGYTSGVTKALDMAIEALSAEVVHKPDYSYEADTVRRLKEALSAEAAIGDYPNDLISRSALMEYCSNQKSRSIDNNDIARFPSAEARPTVIRSRTLLPTKDFMEWAKRIREINPNAVVIPCDAEAPSAEARPTGGADMRGGDSE